SKQIRRLPRYTLFPYTTLFRSLKEILAEEEELAKRSLENDEKKREQLEKVVEKFRYKASKAAMVQSKIKAMDKLSKVVYVEEEKDRKSTRLNSSHVKISYAVFC